jgi:dienelactone hydrolase
MRKSLFVFLACVMSFAQAKSDFFDSNINPKGPYSVGLRIVKQYDYTRAFKSKFDAITGHPTSGEKARPIQTLVWYPAKSGGKPLNFADYSRTRITEEKFDFTSEQVSELVARNEKGLYARLGAEQARAALNSRMLASRDAVPVLGKFPVVIYAAGGGGAADENADMCEYLASHGYIVIASTSMGTHAKSIVYGLEDVETQAADIEFLIGYAQSLPQTDMAHVAVVGWSWGGMSNVFAASRDSRIAALISFDGTREPAFTKLIAAQKITVPWMYVSRTPDTIPEINRRGIDTSFSLLNEAKYSDIYQLTMYPMTHVDFASQRQRQSRESEYTEYSKDEVLRAYSWVVRYVHQFLDAYLKQSADGLKFINNTPTKNAVPAHTMMAEIQRAEVLPPSRESFAVDLGKQGFEHAFVAYQATQKRDVNFRLSEGELKGWGYGLLERELGPEAVAIFKLWTMLYPGNWDAFDSLAEACEQGKDTACAIKNYQRSVELNPKNDSGRRRLKALTPNAPN